MQKHGVDFFETFSQVAHFETVRIILALPSQMMSKVFQFDVKSAFLNGCLEYDVYVEQLQGFVVEGKEDKVCKLKKALNGLKQAPRAWYGRLDFYPNGFHYSKGEPTLHLKLQGDDILVVCVMLMTLSALVLRKLLLKNSGTA